MHKSLEKTKGKICNTLRKALGMVVKVTPRKERQEK